MPTLFPSQTNSKIFDSGNDQMFMVMTDALGRKDRYTQAHAQRVSLYAERLASQLDLSDEEIHRIRLGGMLHDVGKLALNDQLFKHRKATLTQEMWGQVHDHPLIGAALLQQCHSTGIIYDAVLYHHERMDGSGYPFGLQGDEIPLCARIVAVADCFDAITTDRPYQKRKSPKEAFVILDQMAGHCLDAELVSQFIEEIQLAGMSAAIRTVSLKKSRRIALV